MRLCRSCVALIAFVLLAGCSGLGLYPNMGAMTEGQLKALANDKSSAAACTEYIGPGGKLTGLFVNNDKTFGSAGGKTTIKCGGAEVIFEDSGKVPLAPTAPKPPPLP